MKKRLNKVFIGSNLKMYKTNQETLNYLTHLQTLIKDIDREFIDIFILPSYTVLSDCCQTGNQNLVRIGAQNVHWVSQGPFTGEVSARTLRDLGINLVMVGHAERRQIFFETDDLVNKRVLNSLKEGLQILLCVGDTLRDKELGVSEQKLITQLKTALHGVAEQHLSNLMIAYEPVWAIGEGGIVAEPSFANEMHQVLHQNVIKMYPHQGVKVPILYGGSVDLMNAAQLISQPFIDGLFIGRAAWDAHNFNQIIRLVIATIK